MAVRFLYWSILEKLNLNNAQLEKDNYTFSVKRTLMEVVFFIIHHLFVYTVSHVHIQNHPETNIAASANSLF